MSDIKKRNVVKGTLKIVGKGSIKVVRGTIKTARIARASYGVAKADEYTGEGGAAGYAAERSNSAAKDIAARANAAGRRAAGKSVKRIRSATKRRKQMATDAAGAITRNGIKRSSNGIKTAAMSNSVKAARQAQAARANATRAQKAAFAARKASERIAKTTATAVKAVYGAVKSVVKAISSAITLAAGGAWVIVTVLILIVLFGGFYAMMGDADRPKAEYIEPASAVYYFLRTEMGLNGAAAAGVMANIEAESAFNVEALGDFGTSYGLCQWHNERWDRLNEFCSMNNYWPSSLQGQLYYLKWELETYYSGILEYLRNVDDDMGGCYDAAAYFCINFERPADAQRKGDERGTRAVQAFWFDYGMERAGRYVQGMALALTAYWELGNDGGAKFWPWYGFTERVEWCAIFVSWCGALNGYIADGIMPMSCNVDRWEDGYPWYERNATVIRTGPDVVPEPGWVAFFGRGHIGIVYECRDGVVYLVEGNTNDCVAVRAYSMEILHTEIYAYCIPNYTY